MLLFREQCVLQEQSTWGDIWRMSGDRQAWKSGRVFMGGYELRFSGSTWAKHSVTSLGDARDTGIDLQAVSGPLDNDQEALLPVSQTQPPPENH